LCEFVTPVLKAFRRPKKTSGGLPFFSIPEFNTWADTVDLKHYEVKYYKGLGTSTSAEAKEYFSDIDRHRINFRWVDDQEDKDAIDLAFNKKRANDRKEWLA
jgi:DNA topoisomerase-2